MKAKPLVVGVAAALVVGFAGPANAWNSYTHMLIAAVAWDELTPTAKGRVGRLLQLNPGYPGWTADVPDREKSQVAFLEAAAWPDTLRTTPDYEPDTIAQSGPAAARNIGYADHLVHPYWHYRDEPLSVDGTPTRPPEVPNASTQIEAFSRTLRSDASEALKSYNLAWLEHLVGDVHQPLHAVSRFSRDAPGGDRLGSLVNLCETPGCMLGLHAFWDGALGPNRSPEEAIAEAQTLPRAPDDLAAIDDNLVWLRESAAIAATTVYAGPIGPGLGPFKMTPAYQDVARRVARERAALAGRRLAAVINADLR